MRPSSEGVELRSLAPRPPLATRGLRLHTQAGSQMSLQPSARRTQPATTSRLTRLSYLTQHPTRSRYIEPLSRCNPGKFLPNLFLPHSWEKQTFALSVSLVCARRSVASRILLSVLRRAAACLQPLAARGFRSHPPSPTSDPLPAHRPSQACDRTTAAQTETPTRISEPNRGIPRESFVCGSRDV